MAFTITSCFPTRYFPSAFFIYNLPRQCSLYQLIFGAFTPINNPATNLLTLTFSKRDYSNNNFQFVFFLIFFSFLLSLKFHVPETSDLWVFFHSIERILLVLFYKSRFKQIEIKREWKRTCALMFMKNVFLSINYYNEHWYFNSLFYLIFGYFTCFYILRAVLKGKICADFETSKNCQLAEKSLFIKC